MKIVIFTPPLFVGGAETMCVRLATNIDRNEHDVCVVCLSERMDTSLEKEIEAAGIPIYFLGKPKNKKGIRGRLALAKKAYRILSKLKPDVVHSHITATLYTAPWALFHKCKFVHTIHTKPGAEFGKKGKFILKTLLFLKKLTLVAVSKENFALAKKFYKRGDDVVKYVNNPVDVKKYRKNARNDDDVVFVNVSRQDKNKNQVLIIKALHELLKEVPKARLILVGDGCEHRNLIEEAHRLNVSDKIDFAGERSDVDFFLARADIYVSASHREGLPLSMLEAMASKLPIISTNVGGIPDIVVGNGILVGDDNLDEMVEAMIKLAQNKELVKEYGEKSFEIAKEFDAVVCAQKYVKIYNGEI